MEDNQVPDDQVIAAIQKRGISFKPTDKDLRLVQGHGSRSQRHRSVANSEVCCR